MADEAENKPAEGAAPALEPIVKKKKIDAGHAGAHGGAWKIALADMMTAMMAFFLLMWLLGATPEDQRAGIAEYFQPTDLKTSGMGETSGSNGMFGGRSVIDPETMPSDPKQASLMERVTPRPRVGATVARLCSRALLITPGNRSPALHPAAGPGWRPRRPGGRGQALP